MKSVFKILGIIALVAVIGFGFVSCGDDDGGGGDVPPENKPVAKRWGKWVDESATATLNYSVANDGVCTITVGGTAQPNDQTDDYGRWKVRAHYDYTKNAGKAYVYTFEAWTQSGNRELEVQYHEDNDERVYYKKNVSITETRTTYTVYGDIIPKSRIDFVGFLCGDQLGTFYVKIISITENTTNNGGGGVPPENKPVAERWSKLVVPDSTATLDYSVDSDGVCTITVGGIAQPNDETDYWGKWKTQAKYQYTPKANTNYTYVFEAWTQSGNRELNCVYYYDEIGPHSLNYLFTITETRQTFTIPGEEIPKNGVRSIDFHCADQLGTFYVKIISVTENTTNNGGGGIPANLVGTWYTDSGFSGDANFKIEADGKFYDQFWYKPEGNLVTCTYTKTSETAGKFSNAIGSVLEYKDLTATTLVIVAKGNSISGNVGDTMYKKSASGNNPGTNTSLNGTTWKANFTMEGFTMNFTLTFTSSTYTLVSDGDPPETGTYTVSGNTVNIVSPDQGPMTGTLNGNTLTIPIPEMGGMALVFTKQ